MAGSRPLSPQEERRLVAHLRKINPRDRTLVLTGLFGGYRISEILSLTVGQVYKGGAVVSRIGVRPAFLKGNYGTTRWVPVCPELSRALAEYLAGREGALDPKAPLFVSRERDPSGNQKALSRSGAEKLVRCILRKVTVAHRSDSPLVPCAKPGRVGSTKRVSTISCS